MQSRHVVLLLMAVGFLGFGAPCVATSAHAEVAPAARVSVHYQDPHEFTESREAGFTHEYNHGDYLQRLQKFLIARATPMVAPGDHLAITFTNIKLAGGYEPWLGPRWNDVRFMRNRYPPRFDLNFKLTAADGQVIREGTRKLVDYSYLMNSGATGSSDALRYDKALLARWLSRGPANW
ncbi:MAG TPA: DUF3016 domain-containing protein [Rhodanobacteraceae bacterium]|nr:DUF3016 domain-containing protein [Rhodanobacteraceae bacterium]